MLKVASDEVLGSGAVLWFQNPRTNDIHAGIDGSDNQNLVSWFAVREGVIGFPTVLSHLDLWLNYSYKREELEGFVTLKDSSEDGWDYKEKEVLAEYNTWRKTAILGRIGADAGVLNMVNPTGNVGKTQEILEQLLAKGLIVDDTTLYVNNCHLGKISELFMGEEPVFGRFAKMFVSAQEDIKFPEFAPEVPAVKTTSPQDTKLKALREQYKALPAGSPEQGALLKETMAVLMGNMSLSDKESYFPALYKAVAPYLDATVEPSQRPVEAAGMIYEKILGPVAESFLSKWEETGGQSVSSYIITNAKNYARSNIKRPGKDRFTTLTKEGLDQLQTLGVSEDVINKLAALQDTSEYYDKKQFMKALSKILTPEELAQYGEKISSVLRGKLVDRMKNQAPSEGGVGDTAILNPLDITETNYGGQVRENDPGQQAISSESMNLLHSLPSLKPIEKFIIDSRYFQDLTLDQTAAQLAKQFPEVGLLTKERIRQIEEKVLNALRTQLKGKFAKKKVFLSTAHLKVNGG
jgi:hypothetical protein